MSGAGAASIAITYVRGVLETALAAYKWTLSTADTPFQAWNLLFAARNSGICIITWNGDAPQSQAFRAMVTNLKLKITLCARADLADQATMKLGNHGASTDPRLFEIHERVKGAMLSLSIPSGIIAEAVAACPTYRGATPVFSPEGIPLDALEQSWDLELSETFQPST